MYPRLFTSQHCLLGNRPALEKMLFLLIFLCLVPSNHVFKFLNQEAFSRQVNNIVLFSEKSKLSEFLLEARKTICQWGNQNNLVFCLK